MLGPFVHRVDPVLIDLGGVFLWWYGLGFALGFLHLYLFLRRQAGTSGGLDDLLGGSLRYGERAENEHESVCLHELLFFPRALETGSRLC